MRFRSRWWLAFVALLALDAWALWAHHGLGWPYAHKGVFLFHFDFERNLPTAFSALLLLRAAWLSMSVGRRTAVDPWTWRGLGVLFALLAVDEALMLHERLIEPTARLLPEIDALAFAWIVPYGAAVVVLAVALWGWLRRLPRGLRRRLEASAALYLLGALGLEALGAWILGGDLTTRGLGYDLVVTVEESLEMIGLLVYGDATRRFVDASDQAGGAP